MHIREVTWVRIVDSAKLVPRRFISAIKSASANVPQPERWLRNVAAFSTSSRQVTSSLHQTSNAAVQPPHAALSSAQQAHNEMARLLRVCDGASRSAATACYT